MTTPSSCAAERPAGMRTAQTCCRFKALSFFWTKGEDVENETGSKPRGGRYPMLDRFREAGSFVVDAAAVWASTDEPPELDEEELNSESDRDLLDIVDCAMCCVMVRRQICWYR